MYKFIITMFLIFILFVPNISYAKNIDNYLSYSTQEKKMGQKYAIPKLSTKRKIRDFFAGGALNSFNKKFYKFSTSNINTDIELYNNLKYRYCDMQNAYNHGFTTAKLTYLVGKKNTLKLSYLKEIKTQETEIKNFGGKKPAYLDTNCDLWNNQMGINYALQGKKEKKSFKKLSNDIFYNILQENSDFIIDYKNDKRRWDNNSDENNLWEIIKIRKNEL